MPAEFTVKPDGQVTPSEVSVPAYLMIELTVTNRTGAPVSVAMEEATGEFEVPAGETRSTRVEGLPPGSYEVRVSGAGSATVVTGAEPGP